MNPVNENYHAIHDLLEQHGRLSIPDIRILTGIEKTTVYQQVHRLIGHNLIHFASKGRGSIPGIIAFGPNPSLPPSSLAGEIPIRNVVQGWEPVGRRDYMVAALFGPAREAV